MDSAITDWPLTLPTPLLGRRHRIDSRPTVTQMESGRLRVRRQHTSPLEVIEAQWTFTSDQFSAFQTFFETDLLNGTLPFEMITVWPVIESSGQVLSDKVWVLTFWDCRYSFQRTDGVFSVSAAVQVLSEDFLEPLEIITTSLPEVMIDGAYSETVLATGGLPAYSWSIVAGDLPDGLTLNASSGVISGTATTGGVFTFTIQVEDRLGHTDTQELSIEVTVIELPTEDLLLRLESLDFDAEADATPLTEWVNNGGLGTFSFGAEAGTDWRPLVDQVRTVNGHASIRFVKIAGNQVRRFVDNSGAHGLGSETALEVWIVWKRDNDPALSAADPGGDVGAPIQFNNTTTPPYFASAIPFTNGNFYENFPNAARQTITNPTPSLTNWSCYHIRNSAATNQLIAHLNETKIHDAAATFGGAWANLYIGCSVWGASIYSIEGNGAAVILYRGASTLARRQAVAAYILDVYGITIATD